MIVIFERCYVDVHCYNMWELCYSVTPGLLKVNNWINMTHEEMALPPYATAALNFQKWIKPKWNINNNAKELAEFRLFLFCCAIDEDAHWNTHIHISADLCLLTIFVKLSSPYRFNIPPVNSIFSFILLLLICRHTRIQIKKVEEEPQLKIIIITTAK